MRCFAAVDIPREEAVKIEEIQRRFDGFATLRQVPGGSMHVTLEFLGDLEAGEVEKAKAALKTAAERNRPFRCTGICLNVFPNPSFFRVLCVELSCKDAFTLLQKDITEELSRALGRENPHTTNEFTPHITFARLHGSHEKKKILGKIKALNEKTPEISFDVDEIKLKQSVLEPAGPKYTDLGRYRLTA